MNEPPIASPFGSPNPTRPLGGRLSPPLLLKILVGFHMGRAVTTCVVVTAQQRSFFPPIGVILFNAVLFLLHLGLLHANKLCWWLVQGWIFYAVIYHSIRVVTHQITNSSLSVYPASIDCLLSAIGLSLFIYLFTPQERHFFFARSQKVSK